MIDPYDAIVVGGGHNGLVCVAASVRPQNRDMFVAAEAKTEILQNDFLSPHHSDILQVQ